MGNQNDKIQSFIQHSEVETKQKARQVIVELLTQDAAPRQSVGGTENRSNIATVPRRGKSTDRTQQLFHTDTTYNKIELSVKMTTRSLGMKHEQLLSGEQPYTVAGYGGSFSHKSVLKGHVFYILGIVGNPVICVMCSQLSLGNLQCTDRMARSCF